MKGSTVKCSPRFEEVLGHDFHYANNQLLSAKKTQAQLVTKHMLLTQQRHEHVELIIKTSIMTMASMSTLRA